MTAGSSAPFAQDWARPEDELLSAQVVLRCADGSGQFEPKDLGGFRVMLHSNVVETAKEIENAPELANSSNNLIGALVVYVSVKGRWAPLVLRKSPTGSGNDYYLGCNTQRDADENARFYPTLVMRTEKAEDKLALRAALKDRAEGSRLKNFGSTLLKEPVVEAALPAQTSTYADLINTYVAASEPSGWFSWFANPVQSEMLSSLVQLQRDAAPSASPAGEKEVAGSATPAKAQRKRSVKITLVGSPLAGQDLTAPGALDTFGYCGQVVRDGAAAPADAKKAQPGAQQPGGYVLEECAVDAQDELPIQLFKLEPIKIKPSATAPVRLYPLLRTAAYRIPYPYAWQNLATDVVEVPSDSLDAVLKRKIALSQAKTPSCGVQHAVSLADVLAQTLTFPAAPCRTVDLAFPATAFSGANVTVTSGCRPTAHQPIRVSAQGSVRCLLPANDNPAVKRAVAVQLSQAFEPVNIALPGDLKSDATLSIELDTVLAGLRLRPTVLKGNDRRPDAPVYKPVSVRFIAGNQPCGEAFERGPRALPTVADARCKRVPNRLEVRYEVDAAGSDPGVAIAAFDRQPVQQIDLAQFTGAEPTFDPKKAKLLLPVGFSPDVAKQYVESYVKPADLLLKGPRLYHQPDCLDAPAPSQGQPQKPNVVAFETRSKAEHQWPIYARVVDNDLKPLTNCAAAFVETGPDKAPYLTFSFSSMRAFGPRRLLVVSRSQELMDRRGFPKALDTALQTLIRSAADQHKKGAPLTPLDLISATQDGSLRSIFTGEEAAMDPQSAEAKLADIDRVAPRTFDMSLIRHEYKDVEQVIVVMDGSTISETSTLQAGMLSTQLAAKRGKLQFLLSSESGCTMWKKLVVPAIECTDLGGLKQADREKQMTDAMLKLLKVAGETKAAKP